MYNSIYPVNINYTKHGQYRANNDNAQNTQSNIDSNAQNQTFPNGTKVAIDYTKGQINISQVLTDFRSTILAINAPENIRDEVNIYLSLVDRESKKENPSRDIIVSNLKNASKVSDSYIASALNKPSNVVQKWIETLFLQKINLKADPGEINPDFQLEFPKSAQDRIDSQKEVDNLQNEAIEQAPVSLVESSAVDEVETKTSNDAIDVETVAVDNDFEYSSTPLKFNNEQVQIQTVEQKITPFTPYCEADVRARDLFSLAKKTPSTNQGDIEAINYLNEALGIMSSDSNSNKNIRAAIHIERGKLFDSYDYVDYALRDYYEATKTDDNNLKAQAYYKSGQIYDEFSEFSPAMDNYLSSVACSAEVDNIDAQSRVLSKIAGLYAKQFNIERALEFGDLAIETANSGNNQKLIGTTYSNDAQNSQYLGQNDRALNGYKKALQIYSQNNESPEQMAYNYEQAAIVMRKLGNHAKAAKLQAKANLYYQKSQQAV